MRSKPVIVHFVHWPVSGITSLLKSLLTTRPMQAFDHYLLLCEGQEQHLTPFKGLIKGGHIISSENSLIANLLTVPKVFKMLQPSLIHSHSFQPSLWTALFNSKRIPHLRTVHSPYPYFFSRDYDMLVKRSLERWALSRSHTQIAAVSPKAAELVVETYAIEVNTITNGIDHEAIAKKAADKPDNVLAKALLDKRKGRRVLVSCGRLHPEKGYDLLLQSFYQLTKQYDDLMLWLIGDGQQYIELSEKINEFSLSKKVILLGHQENPYWFIAHADIYVASSRYEGFSLATVEALSLGLSVVAAPSTVEPLALNSEVAVCLPNLSIEAITSGIKQLLDDASLTQTLAQAAPDFSQRYSIDVTADCYAKQYNIMLN